MQLSDFDFPFDPALVADRPVEPRDWARLLVVRRGSRTHSHRRVTDLPALLNPGDLVVVNDTKVVPVRISGRKRPGGGRIDLVLVKNLGGDTWEALLKGGGKPGQVIDLASEAQAIVVQSDSFRTVIKLMSCRPIYDLLQEIGQMPLPPYIKRSPSDADHLWYQTIFARTEGAIAAPTAGLHFTNELLGALRKRGIQIATVTLHVGPATFRPVKVEHIQDHSMPSEQMEISKEAAAAIEQAKTGGGRVLAVGTTVVRTLESAATKNGTVFPMKGEARLFIFPGYQFRVVDGLMTNFHLPRTTLLMLVSAFTGIERLKAVYAEAIRERYRFYSYGDAMLIL
ncbi:MAG: tRNA preQ1(34) S-adenosylmethionine ribosyltransferase-isomerase QueA [Nitrospiraceae bacterium]